MEIVDLDDGDNDKERGCHELDEEAACVVHLGKTNTELHATVLFLQQKAADQGINLQEKRNFDILLKENGEKCQGIF